MKKFGSKYGFKQCLRFRRWSRKAYAVLISMSYQVSIGHVSKWIANSALNKNVNRTNNGIFTSHDSALENDFNEKDYIKDICSENIGVNIFMQYIIPSVLVSDYNSVGLFYIYKLIVRPSVKGLYF